MMIYSNALAFALARVEMQICIAGYRVVYRDFVEDHKTPGFLGMIAGRVDHEDQEVVISTKATPSPILRLRTLKHELRHIQEPDWDCGNRSFFDKRPVPERREWLVR